MLRSKYYDCKSELKGPFRVESLDLFDVYKNDYYVVGSYDDYYEAVLKAFEVSVRSVERCGSVSGWLHGGDKGLVYDSQGSLAWSCGEEEMKKLAE